MTDKSNDQKNKVQEDKSVLIEKRQEQPAPGDVIGYAEKKQRKSTTTVSQGKPAPGEVDSSDD